MSTPDYDAVVVGARAAGASTAMLLAHQGHRVLLLDRATLPSEIAKGHFIYRHGPRRLERWGLLDRIIASGSPPVTTLTMDVGDFPLVARDLSIDGIPWGIGPRRGVLDKILLEAAIDAGVEVQDEVAVDDVLTENGRVTGIRGRSARLEPPTPDVLALRAALRERPADSTLFALAAFDAIPRDAFFNPDNLGRIMAPTSAAA